WRLLGVSLATAWLWVAMTTYGEPHAAPLLVLLLLAGMAAGIYVISQYNKTLITPCFLVTLFLVITIIAIGLHIPGTIYLYIAPILCAGILLRPRWGVIGAAGVNLLILALYFSGSEFTIQPALIPSVMLTTGFAAVLGWSFAPNFYLVLDWMVQSYRLNEQRTREAQLHRGQLRRALKDLDSAHYRLKRSNEALVWARWQAEEAKQAKARFAANISHELRTPLNLIIGFSDVMVTAPESYGQPLPSVYRGDLNAIYRNAKHLSDLIDDVLDLSQLEVDRMPLSRENGNLSQVIEEAIRMIEGMVQVKGLYLTFNQPPEPVHLLFDLTRIRQVVLNLLSNAARFTGAGGITVDLTIAQQQAVVTVTDTGCGLAPDKTARIFEEFYQVDDTVRREHSGTGLGLAISKRFVELHGGCIWVQSEPGKGSTFGFSLPLTTFSTSDQRAGAGDRSSQALPFAAGESERILVVQHDDPTVVTLLQRYFENYQIKIAHSRRELLNAVRRWRPTAVIVDTDRRAELEPLFVDSGWEGVPLISCPLPTRPKLAMELQSSDYLLKPVTREALSKSLAKISREVVKVLIVDDDPAMVRLLARMIKAEWPAVRVLQAHGGAAALDIIHNEQPDLMLLDLMMPGLTGLDLLQHLQGEPVRSELEIIIVTATELGEQATQTSGELVLTPPRPLAASEWMQMLRALTSVLNPAPEPAGTSMRAPVTGLPG
ncbi:MAG: ATP-binding protein, partial [Chloroflexota bacterium]